MVSTKEKPEEYAEDGDGEVARDSLREKITFD